MLFRSRAEGNRVGARLGPREHMLDAPLVLFDWDSGNLHPNLRHGLALDAHAEP